MTEAFGISIDSPNFEAEVNMALDRFQARSIDTQYKLMSRWLLAWSGKPPLDHLIIASADVSLGYPHAQSTEWLGDTTLSGRHTLQVL